METKTEIIPDYRIAYMRRTGAYGAENYMIMAKMKEWAKENGLLGDADILFGIAHDDESVKPEDCRYDVAVVIPELFKVDDKVEIGTLIGGNYLVFKVSHTADSVQSFWQSLLEIIEKGNYSVDYNKPILERYIGRLVNQGYCEFCIPLIN